jgi:Raf kinase inhibitor-like YbhB/YbcL family protein
MRFAVHAATALAIVLAIALGLAACSTGGQPTVGSAGQSPTQPTGSPSSTTPSTEVSLMHASPSESGPTAGSPSPSAGPFVLTSSAFAAGEAIPREFSCDGANVSPPLEWTGVPAGTAALVLVVDDPDARAFVHWIVLDLPGTDGHLPQGVAPRAASPQQGRNDFGDQGWGGPCPPSGTHHYRFTLTALGAPLGLADHPAGGDVRSALGGAAVLGKATLAGTYSRG